MTTPSSPPLNYEDRERRDLLAALRGGNEAACPRCGRAMERREVDPRQDVSYVRHRLWLTCPGCRRGVVLDLREVEGT